MQLTKIQERRYYPMLVSDQGTEDPIPPDAVLLMWNKFDALPQEKKEILNSYEIANKIFELQKKFGFTDQNIGMISAMLRSLFFGNLSLEHCKNQLITILNQSGSDSSKAATILDFIQKEILTITLPKITEVHSSEQSNSKKIIVNLPLLKALAEYPRLGEQMVTGDKIKVKNQGEPQRPTLSNWIRYYRDELGIGFHDQVTRGRFLFQSENGKRLSDVERERINLILKSLEEEFPLEIDADRNMVVFPLIINHQSSTPKNFLAGQTPNSSRPTPHDQAKLSFPVQTPLIPARPVKAYVPSENPPLKQVEDKATPQPSGGQARPKSAFFGGGFGAKKNIAGDTLHFSTGHVLPGEKAVTNQLATNLPSGQASNQQQMINSNQSFEQTFSEPEPQSRGQGKPVSERELQATSYKLPGTPAGVTVMPGFQAGINQSRGAALPRSPYSIRPLRMREGKSEEE